MYGDRHAGSGAAGFDRAGVGCGICNDPQTCRQHALSTIIVQSSVDRRATLELSLIRWDGPLMMCRPMPRAC